MGHRGTVDLEPEDQAHPLEKKEEHAFLFPTMLKIVLDL